MLAIGKPQVGVYVGHLHVLNLDCIYTIILLSSGETPNALHFLKCACFTKYKKIAPSPGAVALVVHLVALSFCYLPPPHEFLSPWKVAPTSEAQDSAQSFS